MMPEPFADKYFRADGCVRGWEFRATDVVTCLWFYFLRLLFLALDW